MKNTSAIAGACCPPSACRFCRANDVDPTDNISVTLNGEGIQHRQSKRELEYAVVEAPGAPPPRPVGGPRPSSSGARGLWQAGLPFARKCIFFMSKMNTLGVIVKANHSMPLWNPWNQAKLCPAPQSPLISPGSGGFQFMRLYFGCIPAIKGYTLGGKED